MVVTNLTNEQRDMVAAVRNGDMEVLRRLQESGVSIHFKSGDGGTLLHVAALYGHFLCAEYLLVNGVDASVKDSLGYTALHSAVSRPTKDPIKLFKLLLEHGGDMKGTTNSGDSLLHLASGTSDTDMVQFLLSEGADVHATSGDRSTPLHIACDNSNKDIACILLDHGADLVADDDYKSTPLGRAPYKDVKDAIFAHYVGMTRQLREDVKGLRQELQDLKNLVIATVCSNNTDRGANGNIML